MKFARPALPYRLWVDVAHQAWMSLGDRRLRTFLSVMGIAIGIAAVTLIGVVTQGGKQVVFAELQTFGLRSVWVSRDRKVVDPYRAERPGTGIDNDDYETLLASRCCTSVKKLTPVVYGGRDTPTLARAGRLYSRIRLEGVGIHYTDVNNDSIATGRAFISDDIDRGRHVVLIGERVRVELFGNQSDPVGKELRLGDDKFEVIGVLAAKNRSLLSSIGSTGGQDANGRILLPYRRLQAMLNNEQIDVLQGEVDAAASANAAGRNVADFLSRNRQNAFSYRADTMDQYVQTANNILGGVSKIGIVAASVSLLVAGLGILNIMSTSVIERTREIGLRKALGGTEGQILLQFLLEASLISLIGGVIGLALGGAASVVIAKMTQFPLMPSVSLSVISLLVAIAVGLISGLYPAYRAAQLRPVEALRYE